MVVVKPISQNVTVSGEDGSVRLKVNSDGSINVNTGGGTTADVNLAEVGGIAVPAYGGTFPTSGVPVAFISASGSTMQPAVVAADGSQLVTSAQLPPALGQAAAAASLSVVLASNQSNVPANIAQLGGNPYNSTTLTTGQFDTSTTPLALAAANSARLFGEVKNMDSSINMFIGFTNSVSATNGYLIAPGAAFQFTNYTGAVWVVAASGTPRVALIQW